jgi:3-isopropylmalate dehydratase small subunit
VAKYEDLRSDEHSLPVTTGNAWVFGDGVTGQQVLAAEHVEGNPEDARPFVMAALSSEFARRVASCDVIVAGLDFGTDATHGRLFLRNATNAGLPALVVEETAAIKNGDRLRVDVEAHVIANLSSGDRYVVRNADDETLAILRAGGLSGLSGKQPSRL